MFSKSLLASASALAVLASVASNAAAAPVTQYASSVLAHSSEWSTTSWSSQQVLGAPNTFGYGDIATAWTSSAQNGTLEYVTVGFDTPVYATGATIRETDGNGFVYRIDALDLNGVLHQVWTGTDTSLPGTPVDFSVSWATTSYQVHGLKVYVNTDATTTWEEIDAIQLLGTLDAPTSVPEPASLGLVALGLGLLGRARRRAGAASRV